MAGMIGFVHRCTSNKVSKSDYKKSLKNSPFSFEQIDIIWDFYVTHTLGGGSGMGRVITDYGWNKNDNKTDGISALEKKLIQEASFQNSICFIRSKNCKETLSSMDLANDLICIEHPRAVLLQNYNITVDENEHIKFSGGGSSENHLTCLFRHLRNSFAHGNTYFFDNGFTLLEDKDGSRITAIILIQQQTLLDWIRIIDKNKKYYLLQSTDAHNELGE